MWIFLQSIISLPRDGYIISRYVTNILLSHLPLSQMYQPLKLVCKKMMDQARATKSSFSDDLSEMHYIFNINLFDTCLYFHIFIECKRSHCNNMSKHRE